MQNTINIDNQNNQTDNTSEFFTYDPYSITSPIPTKKDLLQFLKVKELDINSEKVQKCFKYLQEYDTQNFLLLYKLLERIYSVSTKIITDNFVGFEYKHIDDTGQFWCVSISLKEHIEYVRHYLVSYSKERTNQNNYEHLKSKIKSENIWTIEQFRKTIESFYKLIFQLNPEKYHTSNCIDDIPIKNVISLGIFISNLLIYTSHDVIYAINKEINKVSNYDNEDNKKEISNNVYNTIIRLFNSIINALTDFERDISLNKVLYINIGKQNEFKKYIGNIQSLICNFKNHLNRLLNNITLDVIPDNVPLDLNTPEVPNVTINYNILKFPNIAGFTSIITNEQEIPKMLIATPAVVSDILYYREPSNTELRYNIIATETNLEKIKNKTINRQNKEV